MSAEADGDRQLVLERGSSTTAENTALSASRASGGSSHMVTLALHIPRAIEAFRKTGFSITAAANDRPPPDAQGSHPYDTIATLAMLDLDVNEALRALGNGVAGRSDELLPGVSASDSQRGSSAA